MSGIVLAVKGLEGALGMLKGLDEKTTKKLCKQALARGATVIKKAIQRDPEIAKSARLKASIGVSVGLKSRSKEERAKVGPGVGKGSKAARAKLGIAKNKQIAPHAHLFILGTKDRYDKLGRFRGSAPPHDAVRRAYATCEAEATSAILTGLAAGVEREAQKGKSR